MTDESERTFQLKLEVKLFVTDVGELESWVNEHLQLLPGMSYSEEWTDPTDPDSDEPQPAYISDAAVWLPTDPYSMLDLAAPCLVAIMPGVEVEDSSWSIE